MWLLMMAMILDGLFAAIVMRKEAKTKAVSKLFDLGLEDDDPEPKQQE